MSKKAQKDQRDAGEMTARRHLPTTWMSYVGAVLFLTAFITIENKKLLSWTLRGSANPATKFSAVVLEESSPLAGTNRDQALLLEQEQEMNRILKIGHKQDEERILELQKKIDDSNTELSKLKISAEEERTKLQLELQQEQQQRQEQQPQLEKPTSSSAVFGSNDVCSYLPSSEPSSATRLWQKYLPEILVASQNPLMPDLQTDDEIEKLRTILMETLSPSRMRRAVRHVPTFSHHIVKHVIEIIEKRIQDPQNNPPLKIAVFGGSVTLGRECIPKRQQYLDCAWPKRFELLVNQFFKTEVVKIYNLAVGGTSSHTGTNRIKYWMYDDPVLKTEGPDVIINSYSTNDSLPPWDKKWPEDDLVTIVTDNVRNWLQYFVREALQSKLCAVPPLVVHVDDYLGPQQPLLLGEISYVSAMTQIAKYYDTVGISYGEVVRDIVYQDQSDTRFAGTGDVHYGYYAHQTIAWSVGFASLELLISYCDDEYIARTTTTTPPGDESENNAITKDHIRNNKLFLPPPLTRKFLLENASSEFEAAVDDAHKSYVDNNCDSVDNSSSGTKRDLSPCVITWISTPGNFNNGMINRFMTKYQTVNDGWQSERQNGEGWSNKDGWIATKTGATFTLAFENVEKKIRTVSFYFLRSYGDKWKDSRAKFTVERVQKNPDGSTKTTTVVSEEEIAGVHANEDYKYSLTLSETLKLSETVLEGETLAIGVTVVSGSHFKIMGMMLCNK